MGIRYLGPVDGNDTRRLEALLTHAKRLDTSVILHVKTKKGMGDAEAEKLRHDAKLLEEAVCFALVLEKIPAKLAEQVAQDISIPVIGIGAGVKVDGQILVYADMLGMTADFAPKFLRRYADLNTVITDAVGSYVSDVKACDFPNENEQY
jgi:3-methyl-2-oxobutanoate hydroxymethyltransferase